MSDHERCEAKIREQADAIERMAASAVDNASRYASDLAAERRAGALRVERIRSALLEGMADGEQCGAVIESMRMVDGTWPFRLDAVTLRLARAHLAQAEALREVRAEVERLRQVAREMVTL